MQWIDDIETHIDDVLSHSNSRDALKERARTFNPTLTDDELAPILDELEAFVRGTTMLIQFAALEALEHGEAERIHPLLQNAAHYFMTEDDVIPDHQGLYGLMDDAYLAQRYLLSISERHEAEFGVAMIGASLRPAVEVVRQWLGEWDAAKLDKMVADDLRGFTWKTVAVAGALGLGAVMLLGALFNGGGGGSSGTSWESDIAMRGAEMGMSLNPYG